MGGCGNKDGVALPRHEEECESEGRQPKLWKKESVLAGNSWRIS